MPTATEAGVGIIDTNVIDYGFKPKTRDAVARVLTDLSQKYTLVISEYLRFEIYRGLANGRVPKVTELVRAFTAYPVDKNVLTVAAALTTCYECDDQTKGHRSAFSDGDIILAATAFTYKFTVITANRGDFPAPYFRELSQHSFLGGSSKPLVVYELRPDVVCLNAMLSRCYPKPVA